MPGARKGRGQGEGVGGGAGEGHAEADCLTGPIAKLTQPDTDGAKLLFPFVHTCRHYFMVSCAVRPQYALTEGQRVGRAATEGHC